jgi:hypothetical protein
VLSRSHPAPDIDVTALKSSNARPPTETIKTETTFVARKAALFMTGNWAMDPYALSLLVPLSPSSLQRSTYPISLTSAHTYTMNPTFQDPKDYTHRYEPPCAFLPCSATPAMSNTATTTRFSTVWDFVLFPPQNDRGKDVMHPLTHSGFRRPI